MAPDRSVSIGRIDTLAAYKIVGRRSLSSFNNGGEIMKILTVEKLSRAIMKSIGGYEMSREEAESMALHILNFFGYSERIIDNVLQPDDRDLFYMMEDNGLMVTAREETTLFDGRDWRIHYWLFKKDRILELADPEMKMPEMERDDGFSEIYNSVPADAWVRL